MGTALEGLGAQAASPSIDRSRAAPRILPSRLARCGAKGLVRAEPVPLPGSSRREVLPRAERRCFWRCAVANPRSSGMALSSSIAGRLPSLAEARGNPVRELWDRLRRVPGGNRLFTRAIGLAAPYTGTIGARVEVLRRGHSEVILQDRRAVRNHLRCIHAIALANLAELAGNVALAYSMPDDARFIVAGMDIDYLKKARGTIRAVVSCPIPETAERREYEVLVSLQNAAGEEVARARLRTLIGPKR